MRCQLGQEVGYSIRFEDMTSDKTKIKFLTDGMLLKEALSDPLLSKYSVIMVDEAHERALNSDLLLALLRKIQKKRLDLKMIVSSATIEAQAIANFFQGGQDDQPSQCKIVVLDGRSYPVDIQYLDQPAEDYVAIAVETAIKIHKDEGSGDILVFFTGRDEIQRGLEVLTDYAQKILPSDQALQPLPLYAGLSQAEQMYVFSPAAEHTRKVILSTNLAEASVTIDGIVYVIDSGYVKLRTYDPTTNIETLRRTPVSKASAVQRAGRAGRTRAGKCYRLYPEAAYQDLLMTTPPEICRTNLAPTILQLKALGIDNLASTQYLTPPPAKLLARGLEVLYSLDALDDYAKLTTLGSRMAELALPPMLGRALLASVTDDFNCLPEMLTVCAMTSQQSQEGNNLFFSHEGERAWEASRRKFATEEGDHLTYLNAYNAFVKENQSQRWCQSNHLSFKALSRAVSIRAQLERNVQRLGIATRVDPRTPNATTDRILRCITTGYFANAARMNPVDGTFRSLISSQRSTVTMHAHPSSLMFNRKADYVIFSELLESGNKIYIKDISKVEKSWLTQYGSKYYQVKEGK